jgi:hypothetical protein
MARVNTASGHSNVGRAIRTLQTQGGLVASEFVLQGQARASVWPEIAGLVANEFNRGETECLGGTGIPTTHLAELAARGVRFNLFRETAPPICSGWNFWAWQLGDLAAEPGEMHSRANVRLERRESADPRAPR